MSIVLTLYSRAECHLCDEMERQLASLGKTVNFEIEVIDINTDTDLVTRYGERIPVLVADGEILCQHKLVRDTVIDFLNKATD